MRYITKAVGQRRAKLKVEIVWAWTNPTASTKNKKAPPLCGAFLFLWALGLEASEHRANSEDERAGASVSE